MRRELTLSLVWLCARVTCSSCVLLDGGGVVLSMVVVSGGWWGGAFLSLVKCWFVVADFAILRQSSQKRVALDFS